jgi:2-methylcitrate dehydratase
LWFNISTMKKLQTQSIAEFALSRKYEDIGSKNVEKLKMHLLDSLGSFIHAVSKPPIQKMLRHFETLGSSGQCVAPLKNGLSCDRAAQLYTALIRYPDFMDNYMGKEATCHPSDNIGSLLAAVQMCPTNGKDFIAAMAVAYQVECRLIEEIPVMKEGIDHTLLLSYSIVTGLSRLWGLNEEQTANALAIAGSAISPIVTSRASYTTEWKGLASCLDALDCTDFVLLAREDMTGPIALFEGPKGFYEVFGMKLNYNWEAEKFDLISKCALKTFNAEVHSQASLEAIVELRQEYSIDPSEVEEINIGTFLTAYQIIGGGAYGDRKTVYSKEQADHSLFYLSAVALIDGEVYPEQFDPERINRSDVQNLLEKVNVHTGLPLHKPLAVAEVLDVYTAAYPEKMKTKVTIKVKNGKEYVKEKEDYYGFHTRPLSWEDIQQKFLRLTKGHLSEEASEAIIHTVKTIEMQQDVRELTRHLFA